MPEISITVPSYNGAHYVSHTIRHCAAQCWPTLYQKFLSQLLTRKLLLVERLGASALIPALYPRSAN